MEHYTLREKCFLFIFFITFCFSNEFKVKDKSASSLGKANAIMASTENIEALYINPASLGQFSYKEISTAYNNFHWLNIHNGYINFVSPIADMFIFGIAYDYMYFNDEELGFLGHDVTLSGAKSMFLSGLFLGISLNTYYFSSTYDEEDAEKILEFDFSLGSTYNNFGFIPHEIIRKYLSPLTISLSFTELLRILNKDELTESEDTEDFEQESHLPFDINFGLGYNLFDLVKLELDFFPSTINFGVEHWVNLNFVKKLLYDDFRINYDAFSDRLVALRTGLILQRGQSEELAEEGLIFTFGIGLNYQYTTLNYAFIKNNSIGFDHKFSLNYKFGFEKSFLKILKYKVNNIFCSLGNSYTKNPVGYIKIRNISPKKLEIDLSFHLKEYMDEPTTRKISIHPRTETMYPLYAVFNKNLASVTEDSSMSGLIGYKYTYNKKLIRNEIPVSFMLYDIHAMTWDDPNQLAVFITPKDPIVSGFARKALQLEDQTKSEFVTANMKKAMIIFNSLTAYGITYVKDPNSAFAQLGDTDEIVDTIQFPRETLALKTGDCDDTSVLLCSLFESISIQTAVLDIPAHVLMMFNTDVDEYNAHLISHNEDDYLIRDGKVWIALESTMIKDGFLKAWKEGMLEYNKYK